MEVAPCYTLLTLFLLFTLSIYCLNCLHYLQCLASIAFSAQGGPFSLVEIRLGICRDRRDQRSCKIFVSCVNFSRKQSSFLYILQVYTHLNVNFLHNCKAINTFCSILTKRGPNY